MDAYSDHREQKIAYARASLWAPFYTVGMVARIRGVVPPRVVEAALQKLRILYPPLASRVRMDPSGAAWLTTEGVEPFSLIVRPQGAPDAWGKLFLEQERIPFPFSQGPVARFYMLQGENSSDLVAIAPHVVCDGYSMTQVVAEWVALINDPERAVSQRQTPPPVSWHTIPHAVTDNLVLRGFVRVLNLTWPKDQEFLRQEEYEHFHHLYWARQCNGLSVFALSPQETMCLTGRCKQHGVSLTGALIAAFLLAQAEIAPKLKTMRRAISVAVNIRDRMAQSPGQALGVYASSIDLELSPKPGETFWNLASAGHTQIHRAMADRPRILLPLVLEELDPRIADGLVSAVASDRWGHEYDLITRFVKIREERALDISNIGKVNIPETGGSYRLENMLPFPPLVPGGRLALNVLTLDGQMNAILKYSEDILSGETVAKVWERAWVYLLKV